MWTLEKPPVLSKLFLKFFWYNEKVLVSKVYNLKLIKVMAFEKLSIYFYLYKFLITRTLKTLFLKFEKYFFQIFQLSLFFKSTLKNYFSNKFVLTIAFQNMMDYSRFFFWKDLTMRKSKFFFSKHIFSWTSQTKHLLLKDILVKNINFFYQKHFVSLNQISTIFFLNIFFFSLFLAFHHFKKSLFMLNRKIIFYFGYDFSSFYFINKYDEIFTNFNRFLTIQTGLLKWSSFFVDWNYIFATSAQLLRARKIFFFKFFFKNSWFWIFKEKFKNILTFKKNTSVDGLFVWSWSTQILPLFVNKIIYVHAGQLFTWIRIIPGMVGYKLGQFSFTRKIHTKNINLKNFFKNIN